MRYQRSILIPIAGTCFLILAESSAYPQLFNSSRPTVQNPGMGQVAGFGQPLVSGQAAVVSGQSMISGSERFIRGNRSRRDFIGTRNSPTQQARFIGSAQAIATGRVLPASEGVKVNEAGAARINRPLPPQPAKGMYYPKLEMEQATLTEVSADDPQRSAEVDQRLRNRLKSLAGDDVRISTYGNVAVLQGTVQSARTEELLAQMVAFEPGIDDVRSELKITSKNTQQTPVNP